MAMAPIISPRRHLRQPFLLLLFRAEMQDVGCDDGVVQRDAEPVGACATQRFDDRGLVGISAAGAAVLFRHGSTEQAGRTGAFPGAAIDHFLFFVAVVMRNHFRFQPAAGHVLEHGNVVFHPVRTGYAKHFRWQCRHVFLPEFPAGAGRPPILDRTVRGA
jgi:hypothetical protein